jgi:hypothetical protein
MTSGVDPTGSVCGTANGVKYMNFYNWTTGQGTSQEYDVVAQIPLPTNFSTWSSSTPLSIYVCSSVVDGTATTVQALVYDSTGTQAGSTTDISPGSASVTGTSSSANTWTLQNIKSTSINFLTQGTYTAGQYISIRLRLTAPTGSNNIKVGAIVLNYLSNN